MNRDATKPALSAIFVDYDNIYLSLKRKNEDAAKRFSKDAALWIKELETGRLITATSVYGGGGVRRIVMNRCYGNSVPRRNPHDNSTDMNSFPFVRNHFLRAGSETIDCPPLTAQLKNSADIRMVMDIRDMLTHDTYFDEFIILSGDADFTPLIHRLRAHARRTIIYTNEHTVAPYVAIADGEVREQSLIQLLIDGRIAGPGEDQFAADEAKPALAAPRPDLSALRREIVAEVAAIVRQSTAPVPLEALADRAVRQLGHEKTAGSGWGGAGSFRELLATYLPEGLKMSDQPPFVVYEVARMLVAEPLADVRAAAIAEPARAMLTAGSDLKSLDALGTAGPRPQGLRPDITRLDRVAPRVPGEPTAAPAQSVAAPIMAAPVMAAPAPVAPAMLAPAAPEPVVTQTMPVPARQPSLQTQQPIAAAEVQPAPQSAGAQQRAQVSQSAMAIQQAVARIYEACQAPPLSPPEYRAVFEVMANEIAARGLTGAPTLDNIIASAKQLGVELRRDDVRFILEVVSETDPWFEQGASANLFASRFRNFVVARCRTHGLTLSADELDLIEHWFAASAAPQPVPQVAPAPVQAQPQPQAAAPAAQQDRWWSMDAQPGVDPLGHLGNGEEFPRIIRSRMRG